MLELSTHLRPHADIRDTRCVLCGVVYAQFFVGVVLDEGSQPVGDVCPRCLSEPPWRRARWLWERARRLYAEVGEALSRAAALLQESAQLREQRERDRLRRAEDRQRREAGRRQRMAWPGPAVPEPEPATVVEKGDAAELLTELAEGVGLLREWATPLDAVKDAEVLAVQVWYPWFSGEAVRSFVEKRYGEFIANTA